MLHFILSLVLLVIAAVPAPSIDDGQLPVDEIAKLVEQLVSPNPVPEPRGFSVSYPDGFDRVAQKQVFETWKRLMSIGLPAFPSLIEHLDDERYCFTGEGAHNKQNWTVGQALTTFSRQPATIRGGRASGNGTMELAKGRGRNYRPSYAGKHGLKNVESAKEWWSTRKDKSLLELQVESIKWTIDEEAKNPAFSDEEREYMAKCLKEVLASDKPLRPSYPFPK